MFKLLPKTKLVIYFNDLGFPYFDSSTERDSLPAIPKFIINILYPLFKIFHRDIIKTSNYLIANSQTTSHKIYQLYNRTPNIIIFPGVDTNAIVFLITIGEEQGLWGADAFARYAKNNGIAIREVQNNDVIGALTCGCSNEG